jgi:hypothetical protein
MIPKSHASAKQSTFFNVKQARWLCGVLGMLIGVVGKESLLGLILLQAHAEVRSLVSAEGNGAGPSADPWYLSN